MAEITINGVKYTNVPNKKAGTKFAASLTQSNIGASQAVQDYVNSAYFYPLVNAIDINWNGVEVEENSYINTTSDLISYIASKESNIDLSSYATMTYVDQKITDLIGGAPETLDTLKELADALAEEASLAYVTQALDGKADKSSLTNYATNSYVTTELDKKADKSQLPDLTPYATTSYVTTELDKKANKSEIPSMPDLTPYVTYAQANSYYAGKNEIPDLSSYATTSYVTTELDKKANKSEIPSMPDLTPYVSYEQANSYYAYKSDIPDMTNYVSVSSYNALYEEVQHLAYLISYYHSGSEPTPEPITGEFYFDNYYTDISLGSTVTPVIVNTYPYTNITYASDDNSIFTVDSNGTCTGEGIGTANLTAELYDNSNNFVTSSTSLVTVGKMMPVAYWSFNGTALPDNELVVLPYDTLTQSTYTFYSDPATGWSAGNTLYETPGITIDSSNVITVDPTSFEHAGKGRAQVDYSEDSTYQQKSYSIEFKILAQGADPQFFFASDDVYMSQNYTQAEVQLYDLTGLTEQGYTPTLTIGNSSYVSAAPRQDAPNIIQFTLLAEGETTVTATITDGNETHSATVTAHCQWDRDWTDGHVYTSQNNEVNYEYGIVQSGSNPSLTFTASNGNTQDPMNGDLFGVSISNDTNNIISYTSTSSGLTISFDNNALTSASVGDEINMTIIKPQDTTYGYYSKDLRFKVVPNGSDPLLWWENGAFFTVTENDVFSQDPITNWLSNQIIDFSTWEPLTPTLSITNGAGAAHLDQDNVLHGDSVGYCNLAATVTDLNNNTHTGNAIINVIAAE